MKILSTAFHPEFAHWNLPDWCAGEIMDTFPDVQVVKLTSADRILEEIRDTDVLFAWRVTEEAFAAAEKLRWIHTGMAGLTWILIPPVIESAVVVSNSKGVHAQIMGEHAMALILAFSRRLHDCLEFQRNGLWGRSEIYGRVPSFESIAGKTLGVVGLGAIGVEVARRARCFGMRVVGFRRNAGTTSEVADAVYPPDRLDEILPEIDYLVLTVPVTADTESMIDAVRLGRMKPTAVLINLARGEVVDQDALVEALESGRLAGAGLDVFIPDPLPDSHPLFATKNLILTPHVSGTDPAMWRRVTDIFIENIRRFKEGRELINRVDKRKGY